jgi:hypothetical protein
MNSLELNNLKINQKDIEKGQKILAAVYLVTDHLPETEAIRHSLRARVIEFLANENVSPEKTLGQIEILLGGAVFAGLISEKNSSIILYEMNHFYRNSLSGSMTAQLHTLFNTTSTPQSRAEISVKDNKKTFIGHTISHTNKTDFVNTNSKNLLNKSARQDTILSFINERKSAVIKDIISLFPEVSEKTIQRELNALIDSGRITKRGTKRWSIYMAVNSLL